ncbi:MAG: hypothetical protein R3B48_22155 [Kofleriaceae bacterium]
MMSPCDAVAERLALSTPLAELSQHAEDCPRCQGLLAVERKLTARAQLATPAQGFTSRMTVIATQRLVTRQRRRVVGYAALSAAAAVAVTLAVVHQPARSGEEVAEHREHLTTPQPAASDPQVREPAPVEPPIIPTDVVEEAPLEVEAELTRDVRALYELSTGYATPVSADWAMIEAPLKPYDHLLQQVESE